MLLRPPTGTLYFFMEEAKAIVSSEEHISLSFSARAPSGMAQGSRLAAGRELFTLEEDSALHAVDALRAGWFPGKGYIPAGQRASLASAFQSVGLLFRVMVKMEELTSVILAAQAETGSIIAVL